MKKNKWILILVIILLVNQSYSINLGYGEKLDSLKFKDIESLMIKENPTVRLNHNTKTNLYHAIKDIDNAKLDKRKLENAIDGLDDAIDGMNQAINGQTMMIEKLEGMLAPSHLEVGEMTLFLSGSDEINEKFEEVDEKFQEVDGNFTEQNQVNNTLYTSQLLTLKSVKILYESNRDSLIQNRNSMKEQLKEFDKLPIKKMELEKAIDQIDMGNQSIIWGDRKSVV